jgi:hypothetical protein
MRVDDITATPHTCDIPDHVFKLKKALYGLKQAPKAWYIYILKSFLIEHDLNCDKIDTTLFTKRKGNGILIVQIYVDDIIFIITNIFFEEFAKCM